MSRFRFRMTDLARRVGEVYHQVFHIYRRWWMYILPFAAVLLIPIDVIDSLLVDRIEGLPESHVAEYLALLALVGALSSTSLLGQVFMAGAIGLSLLHTRDGNPPRLGWLARHINYRRLIAVDILYVVAVLAGTILLVIPGLLAMLFLALAGPSVEVEDRTVRGAFARSFQLVRRDFWLVFWVLVTTQVGGYYVGKAIELLANGIFGEARLVEALAHGSTSVLIEPVFAIATVLLTMRLIGMKPPPVATPHGSPD